MTVAEDNSDGNKLERTIASARLSWLLAARNQASSAVKGR
jgi:hypothetical protein